MDGRDHAELLKGYQAGTGEHPHVVIAHVEGSNHDGASATETQRDRFYRIVGELLTEHAELVLVLAQVGLGYIDPELPAPVAERVINVGIREQMLIGASAGLALAGIRPIVHTTFRRS